MKRNKHEMWPASLIKVYRYFRRQFDSLSHTHTRTDTHTHADKDLVKVFASFHNEELLNTQ